ncbi:MAG: hypothetical protein RBG13Loki_1948 [Promethearchaeota archaeon CR_4]|nr:MAG: hypothetical protein RBG13Loki_1948 [Candidatus Lokiarchaeota archaeon CR_4]
MGRNINTVGEFAKKADIILEKIKMSNDARTILPITNVWIPSPRKDIKPNASNAPITMKREVKKKITSHSMSLNSEDIRRPVVMTIPIPKTSAKIYGGTTWIVKRAANIATNPIPAV